MTLALVRAHRLSYRVGGATIQDALARPAGSANAPGATAERWFVPGFLPCGECPLCRRGLVGACPTGLRPLSSAGTAARSGSGPTFELPERFLAPVDEPAGVASLADEVAVTAGVVAFALHAMATASLAPGDFAVWLGAGALATAGVALASSRGANSFALSQTGDAGALSQQLAALAAVPATVHGSRKRLLFLTEPDAAAWSAASALGEPGATFVALGASSTTIPVALSLPPEARVLLLSAYHPDFIPEALAALRRQEVPSLLGCADVVLSS